MIKINNEYFSTYNFEEIDQKKYYGFIYVTINKINDKKYLGQHKKWNPFYLGSGITFIKALKKYGKKNFDCYIIDLAKTFEELNNKEIHYISLFNSAKSSEWYNVSEGGHNGNSFLGKTEDEMKLIRKKMSLGSMKEHSPYYKKGYLLAGENNPMYGKTFKEGTIQKISINNTGPRNPRYKDGKPNKECYIKDLVLNEIKTFKSLASLWNYFRETFSETQSNKMLHTYYLKKKYLYLDRYEFGYLLES